MSRIVSVNLAVPEPNPAKGVGVTGINKRPVDHLVTVRAPGPRTTGLHSGLVGDQIFDIEHHGGDDRAVYAYAREDYDWWQARLSRRLASGLFGENLTTEGVDVNGAVIGERWRDSRGAACPAAVAPDQAAARSTPRVARALPESWR